MDDIQKVLIKAGRKDLAQKYYEKVAVSKQDMINKIREGMAESGKYNEKQMDKWWDKLNAMDETKLQELMKNPMKFRLKIRPMR